MKATACVINGVEKAIFKDPKTDDGVKKSQKGCVGVLRNFDGEFHFVDNMDTKMALAGDQLQEVYRDGGWKRRTTLHAIRTLLREQASR